MTTYDERRRQQQEDEAYRHAAERLFPSATVRPLTAVTRVAADDGAFLEVTVWVPRAEIERERTGGAEG